MIEEIVLSPNESFTEIGLEIVSNKSDHSIVRLYNTDGGKIIKMMGWFLVAGLNITSLNLSGELEEGTYRVDILNLEGMQLYHKDFEKKIVNAS